MRVLVVDDEEHLRRVMRLTLEAAGYDVVEAADGEAALRLFGDGGGIDATLLDQKMPGMDGLETLRRLRLRRADACVIMVTAYATIELAVDAMKLGASDFVRKPMTPETLRQAVAAALSKRATPADAASEPIASPAPAPSTPELWTTNGFFVRRIGEVESGPQAADHRFAVRRGSDPARTEIVVSIAASAVASVARESGKDLRASGAFWHRQAENALVNYLWSEAALPDGGRLAVDRASGPMLDAAMAWTED